MKTTLDCIPCLLRQTLEAARNTSDDPAVHEQIMRNVLSWAGEMDLNQSPPAMAQRIHRQLRIITGVDDPYREDKVRMNQFVMEMLPSLRNKVEASSNPLLTATRLSIAGNVIDLGVQGNLRDVDIFNAVDQAFCEPFHGDFDQFRQAIQEARSILYLADNAGEIAFDRLLIEQMLPKDITLAVRGAPVINDVTFADARAVGLDKIIKIIDNGSDAPGTILEDCSKEFLSHYNDADLIIAKGQGNFESLSHEPGNLWFLFKVKCAVIADHTHQPMGTHMLIQSAFGDHQQLGD